MHRPPGTVTSQQQICVFCGCSEPRLPSRRWAGQRVEPLIYRGLSGKQLVPQPGIFHTEQHDQPPNPHWLLWWWWNCLATTTATARLSGEILQPESWEPTSIISSREEPEREQKTRREESDLFGRLEHVEKVNLAIMSTQVSTSSRWKVSMVSSGCATGDAGFGAWLDPALNLALALAAAAWCFLKLPPGGAWCT